MARALVNEPSIVLADEPTGNLDSRTSWEIMRLFVELHAAGQTMIVVTHEDDIAEYAHRVVRVLDGHIVSDERRPPKRNMDTPYEGGVESPGSFDEADGDEE